MSNCSRGAIAIADQGLFSGTHFTINLILARWTTKVDYGSFSVAYTFFAFIVNLQSAVVIDPLYISGASTFSNSLVAYKRQVLWVQCFFGLFTALSLGLTAKLLGASQVEAPTAILAIGSPVMLLVALFRAECYLDRKVGRALCLSSAYCAVNLLVLVTLRALGSLDASTAMIGFAMSSLIVAVPALAASSGYFLGKNSTSLTFRRALSEHTVLAKWLLPTALLNTGTYFVPTWLTAYYLGLEATAGFRALVNLILPLTQCFAAASNILLPRLSRDWANHRDKFHRTVAQCATAATIVCGLFWCFGTYYRNEIEQTLFNGKFQQFSAVIPLMCALPLLQALSVLYSLALRAMRCPGDQTKSAIVQSCVGVLAATILIPRFALYGTTVTYLFTYGLGAVVMATMYYRRLALVQVG